ncbi:MAG: hypothetical protein WAK21_05880 [Candidatus Sulfotelmatobacter sp.]
MENLSTNRPDRNAAAGLDSSDRHGMRTATRPKSPVDRPPLDDRIRELCAVIASGEQNLRALVELQSALHEHNQRLRLLAARKLLGTKHSAWRGGPPCEWQYREVSQDSLL